MEVRINGWPIGEADSGVAGDTLVLRLAADARSWVDGDCVAVDIPSGPMPRSRSMGIESDVRRLRKEIAEWRDDETELRTTVEMWERGEIDAEQAMKRAREWMFGTP